MVLDDWIYRFTESDSLHLGMSTLATTIQCLFICCFFDMYLSQKTPTKDLHRNNNIIP